MTDTPREPVAAVDREVPHASRIYDYLLGGTDHYEVDRQAAAYALGDAPGGIEGVRAMIRANRDFLVRAVTHLAAEAGIRQFLDIGTGVPNADNVHAVAQAAAPATRTVYVDNDPTVLAHARDLLAAGVSGTTAYIDGDLRHPAKILREARQTLDFDQPIAVMLIAILHFIPDDDEPGAVVRQLVDAVPSGSYLAISHITTDMAEHRDHVTESVRRYNERTSETFIVRDHPDVVRFFDGLELVDPGVVPLADWRPGDDELTSTFFFGGIARKP